jgi:CrcB protein
LGALCRYWVGLAAGVRSFPVATLGINVVGSFLLGATLTAGPSRLPGTAVTAIAVGFLGAFTTFSTFSYETQSLVRQGRAPSAAIYVGLSVGLGIAAAALGVILGRSLTD